MFFFCLDFYVVKCRIVVICIGMPWDVVMQPPALQAQIAFILRRINAWVAPTPAEVTKIILPPTRVQIDYLTPPYRLAGTQMHAVLTLIAFLISTVVVVLVRHRDNAKPQNHLLKMLHLYIITSRHYLRKARRKLVVVVLIAS